MRPESHQLNGPLGKTFQKIKQNQYFFKFGYGVKRKKIDCKDISYQN